MGAWVPPFALLLCVYGLMGTNDSIAELPSPFRSPELIRGRIELTILAVGLYAFRSSGITGLIDKPSSSLARRFNLELRQGRDDPIFNHLLDTLDREISETALNNASMRWVAP